MMEFTISRIALSICGIVMLAAVLSPVAAIYEGSENVGYQEQCDTIADMIDLFAESESDSITVCIDQMLPNGTVLEIGNHTVTVIRGEVRFTSLTSRCVITQEKTFGNNEIVKLTKNGGDVIVTKLTS